MLSSDIRFIDEIVTKDHVQRLYEITSWVVELVPTSRHARL